MKNLPLRRCKLKDPLFSPSLLLTALAFCSPLFLCSALPSVLLPFSILLSFSLSVHDAFVEILLEISRLLFWKVLYYHACGLSFISWLWRISEEIGKSDQNQRMVMGISGCGFASRFSVHDSSLFNRVSTLHVWLSFHFYGSPCPLLNQNPSIQVLIENLFQKTKAKQISSSKNISVFISFPLL